MPTHIDQNIGCRDRNKRSWCLLAREYYRCVINCSSSYTISQAQFFLKNLKNSLNLTLVLRPSKITGMKKLGSVGRDFILFILFIFFICALQSLYEFPAAQRNLKFHMDIKGLLFKLGKIPGCRKWHKHQIWEWK